MRRLHLRDERGFTLIEMVVVCAILGLVLTGLTTTFLSGTRSAINLDKRFQAQQAARLALDAMRIDARNGCAANVPSTAKLVLAPRADEQRHDLVRVRCHLFISEGDLVRPHQPDDHDAVRAISLDRHRQFVHIREREARRRRAHVE